MGAETKFHMIGNAHIDPVWLWLWPEGLEATRATFRSALDRMEETPEFVFTAGQAAIYEWVEKTDPIMFERIRARVAEGRWDIVNGWWMQPDCNIPSGESFVRQGLMGQGYFRDKLGKTATIAYNVDSFGHNGMLPQILRKCGFEGYVFMRPDSSENPAIPTLFEWQSPDGSTIPTYKLAIAYNLGHGESHELKPQLAQRAEASLNSSGHLMVFYGVGNHGGGPTKAHIRAIQELAQEQVEGREVAFSTPGAFFSAVGAATERGLELPVHASDMQHHAVGCYSVHSEVKANNRKAEGALGAAEKLAVLAGALVGHKWAGASLREAWKGLLFNQFHDVLAGTSFPEAYDDARNLHGRTLQTAREETTFATQAIATRINTSWTEGWESAIVVFNPHSWSVEVPVEVVADDWADRRSMQDDAGRAVALQITDNRSTPTRRRVVTFTASVPALGYRAFRTSAPAGQASPVGDEPSALVVKGLTVGNPWFTLEVDPATGGIARLVDKASGHDVIAADRPGCVTKVLNDDSDTWSHGVVSYADDAGQFVCEAAKVVEEGPVRACIRTESVFGGSRLTQEFLVYRNLPWVEVRATVDWHEQRKLAKVLFPVAAPLQTEVAYSMPFGFIRKPTNGSEEPMQTWADITGTTAGGQTLGLAVANDSKYGASALGPELAVTALRSPAYAHHDPDTVVPGKPYRFIDQGVQRFRLRLLPHVGPLDPAAVTRLAAELNEAAVVVEESSHPGDLPLAYSGLSINCDTVVVSGLKRAEERPGTIARLWETAGQPVTACIKLAALGREWVAEFGPYEVKTFFVPDDGAEPVSDCDMLERP